jgi:hypothetical protein
MNLNTTSLPTCHVGSQEEMVLSAQLLHCTCSTTTTCRRRRELLIHRQFLPGFFFFFFFYYV